MSMQDQQGERVPHSVNAEFKGVMSSRVTPEHREWLLDSLLDSLESSVTQGTEADQIRILRGITELFLENAGQQGGSRGTFFDTVFTRMSELVTFRARLILAEWIASEDPDLPGSVRTLAFDPEIAIAGPVLANSTRLSDDDLVAVIGIRGAEHGLAIAGRLALSEPVTDALVTLDDRRVDRRVAANGDARIGMASTAMLAMRASSDASLAELLAPRLSGLAATMPGLVEAAVRHAAERLVDEHDVSPSLARLAAGEAAVGLASGPVWASPEAVALARRSLVGAPSSESDIAERLRAGQILEALILMGDRAGLTAESAIAAFTRPTYDQLLILCRGLDFTRQTFLAALQAKLGRPIDQALAETAADQYRMLTPELARRTLRLAAFKVRASRGL